MNFDSFVGRKIVAVDYLEEDLCVNFLWARRPVRFVLDDGRALIPQSDDDEEGGAMFIQYPEEDEDKNYSIKTAMNHRLYKPRRD
jgi:hypothetical protein